MTVLAIGCHPDDIEFMMGGTLVLLRDRGQALHYLNVANGSCGTPQHDREEIVRIRRAEAQASAKRLRAVYHESLVDDLDVFYAQPLIRQVAAVVRDVRPDILLTMSPQDYMEDHMNTCRVAVTAAFVRGMRNFRTDPPRPPVQNDLALYHALPYGLRDMLDCPVTPEFTVDIGAVMEEKRALLSCHASQKDWLDQSQGLRSYLTTMVEMSRTVGAGSGRFTFAEGWRRHNPLGYAAPGYDPLRGHLKDIVCPFDPSSEEKTP
jgi:LmbE family N-acetylglucosaminyl deacetylase